MHRYINGNYIVKLYEDGTKVYESLRVGEEFISEFPDSIDIKITNKCKINCNWCHESSTNNGAEMNIEDFKSILSNLVQYPIELAIGGGDILTYSKLEELISWIKKDTLLQPRVTINIKSIKYHKDKFEYLVNNLNGIGISIDNSSILSEIDLINSLRGRSNVVFHIIANLIDIQTIKDLLKTNNVLILGYKTWGRGLNFNNSIPNAWIMDLKKLIYDLRFSKIDNILSFDNLGLEQLNIRSSLLNSEWESMYMGEDFTHTMYIDMVNKEFAPTSRSTRDKRMSFDKISLLEYFNKFKL